MLVVGCMDVGIDREGTVDAADDVRDVVEVRDGVRERN